MTEAEWLACDDPEVMLKSLASQAGDRRLRLFACACCRRVWRLVLEGLGRTAVKAAERYADGLAGGRELSAAQLDAERAYQRRWGGAAWDPAGAAARFAMLACLHAARSPADAGAAREAAECARAARRADAVGAGGEEAGERAARGEAKAQAALLRDLVGNPFRPVAPDPAWRTARAVALAEAAYEERLPPSGELDPRRLAALADALAGAGCADRGLLEHLRGGVHVRGCWGVDLLLGKQ
jgi:hypothetical protein